MYTSLQMECIKKVNVAIDTANNKFNLKMKYPLVTFNQRGKTAGTAKYGKYEITLNNILLEENGNSFVNDVPVHEATHLIARAYYGYCQGHNKFWKNLSKSLGSSGNRCHSFSTVNSTIKRKSSQFIYTCGCSGRTHILSSIRHNRAMRGITKYRCSKCKQHIEYKGVKKNV